MRLALGCAALFVPGVLLVPGKLLSQTCTITSPTASQLLQTAAPLALTATVSSAPSAYSLEFDVDNKRWAVGYAKDPHPWFNDYRDAWQGPWAATWYTGLNGDGPHFVSRDSQRHLWESTRSMSYG